MNIGVSMPLPAYIINAGFMARKAEELGFDSLWYGEHPMMPVHTASPFPSSPDGSDTGDLLPLCRPLHSPRSGVRGYHNAKARRRYYAGARAKSPAAGKRGFHAGLAQRADDSFSV